MIMKKITQRRGKDLGIFLLDTVRFGITTENKNIEKNIAMMQKEEIKIVFCLQNIFLEPTEKEQNKMFDKEVILYEGLAKKYDVYLVRVCSVGSLLGKKQAGRSFVATPQGISWRVSNYEQRESFLCTITLSIATKEELIEEPIIVENSASGVDEKEESSATTTDTDTDTVPTEKQDMNNSETVQVLPS